MTARKIITASEFRRESRLVVVNATDERLVGPKLLEITGIDAASGLPKAEKPSRHNAIHYCLLPENVVVASGAKAPVFVPGDIARVPTESDLTSSSPAALMVAEDSYAAEADPAGALKVITVESATRALVRLEHAAPIIDIETDGWHHLLDCTPGGALTAFYYGAVPSPDPYAGDTRFHPSQSIRSNLPIGYSPIGYSPTSNTDRIRIEGLMKSANELGFTYGPHNYYDGLYYPAKVTGIGWQWADDTGSPPVTTWLGADVFAISLIHFIVYRRAEDLNLINITCWPGLAEYVRFKVFVDPERT